MLYEVITIPEMTAAFMAQYSYDLPVDGWTGAFRFEGNYTDDSYTQFRPTSNDRITSYNVCYTKLLRAGAGRGFPVK